MLIHNSNIFSIIILNVLFQVFSFGNEKDKNLIQNNLDSKNLSNNDRSYSNNKHFISSIDSELSNYSDDSIESTSTSSSKESNFSQFSSNSNTTINSNDEYSFENDEMVENGEIYEEVKTYKNTKREIEKINNNNLKININNFFNATKKLFSTTNQSLSETACAIKSHSDELAFKNKLIHKMKFQIKRNSLEKDDIKNNIGLYLDRHQLKPLSLLNIQQSKLIALLEYLKIFNKNDNDKDLIPVPEQILLDIHRIDLKIYNGKIKISDSKNITNSSKFNKKLDISEKYYLYTLMKILNVFENNNLIQGDVRDANILNIINILLFSRTQWSDAGVIESIFEKLNLYNKAVLKPDPSKNASHKIKINNNILTATSYSSYLILPLNSSGEIDESITEASDLDAAFSKLDKIHVKRKMKFNHLGKINKNDGKTYYYTDEKVTLKQ